MKTRIGMKALWAMAVLFLFSLPAHGRSYHVKVQTRIAHYVKSVATDRSYTCDSGVQKITGLVSKFYHERNYLPAWIDVSGLKPEASILIRTIRNAEEEGLPHKAYPIESINRLTANAIFSTASGNSVAPDLAAQIDIALSTTFFLHSIYLSEGRLQPGYLQGLQKLTRFPVNLISDLEQALATHTLAILLTDLKPPQKCYAKLKGAKERYEAIIAAGGWPRIPTGSKLKIGDRNENVILLRKRLNISGDLNASPNEDLTEVDDALESAVRHFQERNGLVVDGVVGPSTIKALNVSARERLQQILINLERWRLLPRELGERYIEVNVPDFRLKVIEKGEVVKTMRVVVGRKNRPTPMLAGRVTHLKINPYWTIPPGIAKRDLLPKIRKDSSYLKRQKIKVFENWKATAAELDPLKIDWNQVGEDYFPFKLRQEPDHNNALGQIKFMFPNKLSVYLHDTPAKELFNRRQRSFSSGCVRVERPLELAAYLLDGNSGWDWRKIIGILEKGEPTSVYLRKSVPVYLLYWTAWVEDKETVHFREDIYGRDQALAQLLEKQLPVFKTCQNGLIPNPMIVSHHNGATVVESGESI